MKRVLVAGAAGFLGSHLAKHHLESGDVVLGLDDFCSSSEESAHLKNLKSYKNFDFSKCDITEQITEDEVGAWSWQHKGIDIIYSFACPASPPIYQAMPIHTMMTCVVGTERLLRLAERYDAVLVHASTSEVYGDPEESPQKENYRGRVNSYGPRACYDEGKRASEALCWDYLHKNKVDARLVRIFNTFGENMDPFDGRVVSNFIRQALRGEKLTVYGDGSQTRSFCYVSDLISGIIALGELDKNPECPINLGSPDEWPIKLFAKRVLGQILLPGVPIVGNLHQELESMIAYHPLPADDPKQRRPNIEKAQKILNWSPQIGAAFDGLEKTIAYFRTHPACQR